MAHGQRQKRCLLRVLHGSERLQKMQGQNFALKVGEHHNAAAEFLQSCDGRIGVSVLGHHLHPNINVLKVVSQKATKTEGERGVPAHFWKAGEEDETFRVHGIGDCAQGWGLDKLGIPGLHFAKDVALSERESIENAGNRVLGTSGAGQRAAWGRTRSANSRLSALANRFSRAAASCRIGECSARFAIALVDCRCRTEGGNAGALL